MAKFLFESTEIERQRILNLHNTYRKKILFEKEQKSGGNIEFPTQRLGTMFPYGKYESEDVKNYILNLKPKIEEFIKNSDSSKFVVNISAGESQVTNPQGFEEKGSLALARANSVKKYFEEIFSELIKNGTLVINLPKDVNEVKIGTTPYKKGDQSDPTKKQQYSAEQFVDFSISGIGEKNLKGGGSGGEEKFCRSNYSADGKVISSMDNFINVKDWNIGEGEGNVFIYSEAHDLPDILYFEYNGKTLPSGENVTFRGGNTDYNKLLLGTALRIKFGDGGNLPPQIVNTTFIPLDINIDIDRWSASLDDLKSTGWGLQECFSNFQGDNSFENLSEFIPLFISWDSNLISSKKLLKNIGNKIKWGYLTSEIKSSIYKNIPMEKVKGLDVVKIINVAPIGGTKWSVGSTCAEI
jgi:hypothetical protein